MKKQLIILGVGISAIISCQQNKPTEITTTESTTTTTAAPSAADVPLTRNRADQMSSKMATDMQFDTSQQSRVRQIYYNREQRIATLRKQYDPDKANKNTGPGSSQTDTAGMYTQLQTIDQETDNELKAILKPEQYQSYLKNRKTYYTEDGITREIKVEGDEISVKTGDIKVKAQPGESKVKTSTYESKIKGEKREFKSDDTKMEMKEKE